MGARFAAFPARNAPQAIPIREATRPKVGAARCASAATSQATTSAAAAPAATARHSMSGTLRVCSMRRAYRPKRNRSARPTRIGGIAKGAGLKRRRRHHVVATTTTYFFFLELFFFDDFFFAGISGSPPPGHALWVYRHTRVANVNRRRCHDPSEGRRGFFPKSADDPLAELRRSDVGRAAIADDADKTGLEAEALAAIATVLEVGLHVLEVDRAQLLVEEGVEPLEAVPAVHRVQSDRGAARNAAIPRSRATSMSRRWRNFRPR